MKTSALIIDCDPGVDDAVALFLAFASPELETLAITTVGGNVPVAATARNARIMRQIAGREDVPVFAGAERPLVREPAGAGDFHGPEGLGDRVPFEPDAPLAEGDAVQAIVERVMSRAQGAVTLAVMGPMTNVALALRAEPRLADWLGPVVVMGGARSEGGNITASAEFNVWADPDAAAEVFDSGCEMIVLGLDATHQVRATEARIAAIEAIGSSASEAAAAMLRFSQRVEGALVAGGTGLDGAGLDGAGPDSEPWGPPLHDPCTVAWVLEPGLFRTRPCRIRVEVGSDLTRGHTAVEFRVDAATARHRWATAVDGQGVFDLITQRLSAQAEAQKEARKETQAEEGRA
ncbi:nucleoside hydrolase [soil metagenome]